MRDLYSILDFIWVVIVSFFVSLIAAITRGDGENILKKIILGTIFGIIFLSISLYII